MSKSMPKGKDMWNMLTNGAIFSAFKHTDPLTCTVRGRFTLVNKRIFRNGSFRELKIESNDLAKVLLESNQKSNGSSMNRKCGLSVTKDEI